MTVRKWLRLADLRLLTALAAILLLAGAALQPPLNAAEFASLHLPVNNFVLRHAINPDAALLLIASGWLLLCVEFCRPGSFLPGAVGVLAISLGGYAIGCLLQLHAMLPVRGLTLIGIAVSVILTIALLRVAWLARRSKFQMGTEPGGQPVGYTARHTSGYSSTAKPTE